MRLLSAIFSKNDPPDLDEIFDQLRRFLGDRKRGGDDGGGPRRPRRNGGGGGDDDGAQFPLPPPTMLITLAAALVVLGYLFVGFFTVQAERARGDVPPRHAL